MTISPDYQPGPWISDPIIILLNVQVEEWGSKPSYFIPKELSYWLHNGTVLNGVVLVGSLLLWWTPWPKATWDERVYLAYVSQSIEGRQGRRNSNLAGSRLVQKPWSKILLSSSLLVAYSVCFLIEFRTTSWAVVSPTCWATPCQSLTKKTSYRLAYSPVWWRDFLKWGSLLSNDSSLCQVAIKLAISEVLLEFFQALSYGSFFAGELVV